MTDDDRDALEALDAIVEAAAELLPYTEAALGFAVAIGMIVDSYRNNQLTGFFRLPVKP